MPELATAWITLVVSADNMQRDIRRELNRADDGTARTVGRKMGKQLEDGVGQAARNAAGLVESSLSERLGNRVGTVVGRSIGAGLHGSVVAASKVGALALTTAMTGAAGVAAVGLGGVGLALTKGFDRLKSIDEAKFKLEALGNDSASVAKIMDSALASVKGTAFGMDDAVTAAASAVAAGIKPGQDLTKYLTEVGDASAIAGTSFADMGSIFNKIQTSNKAYTDDLQQLSDRGIPIFTWLQKEYGVTGDALSTMVQNGEVDAAHFQRAIETNIGGAAQKMGQSFQGSVQNAEAALGRLGAALLKPLFTNAAGGIGDITSGLDKMTTWVNAHQPEIINFFTDMGITAVSFAQDVVKSFGEILQGVGDFSHGLGSVLSAVGIDNDLQAVGDKLNGIGGTLITTAAGFQAAKDKIGAWGQSTAASAEIARLGVAGVGIALAGVKSKDVKVGVDTSDISKIPGLKTALDSIPPEKTVNVIVKGTGSAAGAAQNAIGGATIRPDSPLGWVANNPGLFVPPVTLGPPAQSTAPQVRGVPTLHKASGGAISGPGGPRSDSIFAMLSDGEFIVNADATRRNLPLLEIINSGKLPGFADGGAVTLDAVKQYASQISGGTYVRGGPPGPSGTDCSGGQAWMANFVTGGSGRFTTGNEAAALASRGFITGDPPAGTAAYWIGWKNGGPGGGHTAGTIVDPAGGNVNVEMGGSSGGGAFGGSAAGAAGFPNRAWIQLAGGEAASSGVGSFSNASSPMSGSGGVSSGGGSSSGGGIDGKSLGQIIGAGLTESLSVPGFMNPLETPNAKSAQAALNYGLGLLGIGGGEGGFGTDLLGGLLGGAGIDVPSLTSGQPSTTAPLVDPATTTHGQGAGTGPGPAVVVNGNVGMDPRSFTDRVTTANNAAWNRNMSAVRPG